MQELEKLMSELDKDQLKEKLEQMKLDSKDLEKQLNSAASAAYFMQGNGPNYSVRIGRVSQDAKQVAKNAEEALS